MCPKSRIFSLHHCEVSQFDRLFFRLPLGNNKVDLLGVCFAKATLFFRLKG